MHISSPLFLDFLFHATFSGFSVSRHAPIRLQYATRGVGMILAPLAGVALILSVATGPIVDPKGSTIQMSAQQRNAAVQPLVRSATECIANAVFADTRFRSNEMPLGDLIVESVNSCVGPVRAMIDAYDRYFGDGTGEAFFMGPYLDVLPAAVDKWATERRN
jgi:hypothetical protein